MERFTRPLLHTNTLHCIILAPVFARLKHSPRHILGTSDGCISSRMGSSFFKSVVLMDPSKMRVMLAPLQKVLSSHQLSSLLISIAGFRVFTCDGPQWSCRGSASRFAILSVRPSACRRGLSPLSRTNGERKRPINYRNHIRASALEATETTSTRLEIERPPDSDINEFKSWVAMSFLLESLT
jgi:hypothetical protein